jgi:alpha-D-xyloside xylohydrolase
MKQLVFITLLIVTLISCKQSRPIERLPDGILVHVDHNDGRAVRIRVMSDDIVQVRASAGWPLRDDTSLMVIANPMDGGWELVETPDSAIIITASFKTVVSLPDGRVSFLDLMDRPILEEHGELRSFEPFTLDTVQTFHVMQSFESAADEAFYGLGAHQNGQMNYKGQDVDLVQHNIVDVVPFIYSSRNYGILWDNYSASKFGDEREYEPLSQDQESSLQLFSRTGESGGLTADYYVGDHIVWTQLEDTIAIEFLETPAYDTFPQNVSRNGKIIWEGSFASEIAGAHKFLIYASNYFKVWVDGNLILDKWRQNWNPWSNKFTVDMRPGEKHTIKIEWIPDGGYMAVKHLNPLAVNKQQRLTLWSEVGDEINYYFIHGNNADEVIAGYRHLTGKAPIPPKWAMGYWQSRERYRNQKELIDVVKEYRKRKIPLDNIVLDWQYWKDPDWGTHTFDATRFPDPAGMVEELHHKLDAHIMISVWPKFNKGTSAYDEMNEKGYLFTRNIEKGRKDWVGPGYQNTFYDAFNRNAGILFWQRVDENLNAKGFDAYWMDATEPDMHSNLSLEERKLNMNPTALGAGARYFNAYSLVNSRNIYEGHRKSSPDKRVFILTRSAYGGQQRYASATWSGDIVSRWSDFQDQIAAGINFSLSGIPYWTMDIGGFAVEKRYENATGEVLDEWRELNTRWFQFGTFCPIFRSHGQFPFREIYNIAPAGTPAYETMVYYDKLRYRLMPYIYSLTGHTYFDDYTIMRGLVMDFPNDPAVRNIADQYMFGPAFLVNPVYQYKATSRNVYLPSANSWYSARTGKVIEGGTSIVADSPLQEMPLYIRAGSIVPTGPDIQHTAQVADRVILYVYAGRDGNFNLYEDNGLDYGYEQNKFAIIPLAYRDANHTLTIGNRYGGFDGMLEQRTFYVAYVSKESPRSMDFSTEGLQTMTYDGTEIVLQLK